MLIAITGLHGSGKSYFANNIPIKFGFKVFNKKQIIEYICKKETNREDWDVWYRQEYRKDPYTITAKILSCLKLDEDIILDAVHSLEEWKIIQSIVENAALVVVTTPEYIRMQRREKDDDIKDIQRIKYWHTNSEDSVECLLTKVSWSFNGGASMRTNEISFKELTDYLRDLEQEKQKNINISKDETLGMLMQENEKLDLKLIQAQDLLSEYAKFEEKTDKLQEIEVIDEKQFSK
jgi:cytidylate kinase